MKTISPKGFPRKYVRLENEEAQLQVQGLGVNKIMPAMLE
jgi:hypothetical protein